MTGLASAVTVEDRLPLLRMPATDSVPSCDIPATITFKRTVSSIPNLAATAFSAINVIGDNDKLEFVNMGMTRKLLR